MKRLILMGGRPWFAEDGGKKFVETLFRYYPKEVKLAFCIFAQPEKDWDETRKWNTGMFDKFSGERRIEYQIMTHDNFEEVSVWAEVIYIPGGYTEDLLARLKDFDLSRLWDGKVVAGASAGANFMCKGFISLSRREFGNGLGWVDVSCIPHWRADYEDYAKEDWDWAEQETLRRFPDLPVLCIPESEFVEFTVK